MLDRMAFAPVAGAGNGAWVHVFHKYRICTGLIDYNGCLVALQAGVARQRVLPALRLHINCSGLTTMGYGRRAFLRKRVTARVVNNFSPSKVKALSGKHERARQMER